MRELADCGGPRPRSPNPGGLTQESVGPLQGINNLVASISKIFTYRLHRFAAVIMGHILRDPQGQSIALAERRI